MEFLSPPEFAEWLSRYHHDLPSYPGDLTHILDFTLLWNIFERDVCGNDYSLKKAFAHISASCLDPTLFSSHLDFFQRRYERRKDIVHLKGELLSSIRKPSKDDECGIKLLHEVLFGEHHPENLVKALIFVCYRIRNNLFHGEKRHSDLSAQRDLFNTVNSVLQLYLDRAATPQRNFAEDDSAELDDHPPEDASNAERP